MILVPGTLYLLLVVLMFWVPTGSCSGIDVTNVTLGTLDAGTGTAPVTFDISWNNSWRSTDSGAPAPNNWDAAWVFVKFRVNGGDWKHASLNDTGHSAPVGASLDVGLADTGAAFNIATNPVVGAFIYRSADGTGTFSKTGFSLNWKYSQDSVTTSDTIDVRIYAIEMVYIPDGAFFAGDNSTGTGAFQQGSTDTDPWYIESESAITTANAAGSGTGVGETAAEYYYVTDDQTTDAATGTVFTIPAAFPKGYQKFYMMKGEISQYQWLAFFNTLTATQKSTRDITSATGKNSDSLTNRNNISWTGSGDATLPDQGGGATYGPVAMTYLSWADVAAYLDWAGLRPMSELEYERAGRGPYRAVSGEYSWGTTSLTQATSISNGGTATESAQSGANIVHGGPPPAGVFGPMRVGAIAYSKTTRTTAGAGYYGNVDLSGNAYERTITVGNSGGRAFEGRYHGNGVLTSTGNANSTTWPGTNASGTNYRGGAWDEYSVRARLSDRHYGGYTSTSRDRSFGGRGVRSAP